MKIVLDTSVFVNAIIGPGGPAREIVRLALMGRLIPQFSTALITEYEDVCNRLEIMEQSQLNKREINELLDALFSVSEPVRIYYGWRPNLMDEHDNHVLELAISAGATLITSNIKDFTSGDLRFPGIPVLTPADFLQQRRRDHGNPDDTNS